MSNAVLPVYGPSPVVFERGEGVRMYDDKGKAYLDFIAGIAVNSLGHCHPALVNALTTQANKLWHTSNMFRVPGQERLAQRYVDLTFADFAFFTNSGAESIEGCIKIARRYHWSKGQLDRIGILSFEGSFHGRTLGGINAGAQEKYREGFGPRLPGFRSIPWEDVEALNAEIVKADLAAVIIEPVQGEGGIRPVPDQCLKGLRDLCDSTGTLLIFDEVQCGMGRTGKLFAHEWAGIFPDIMMVAKGIGGGFPLGALLATERAALGMTAGAHGSTYGGNPLACAVGSAVLNIIAEGSFLSEVNRKAALFRQGLESLVASHPKVFEEVRGAGLMLGLKCRAPNTDIVKAGYDEHLLTVPAADNVIRLLPALNIPDADITESLARLDRAATRITL